MGKRIAIITPTFPPYRGGIGKIAEMDARQLAGLGHEVHVFRPRTSPVEGVAENAPYVTRDLPVWLRHGNAALSPGAWRLLRRFDLVFLHHPFFGASECVGLMKRFVRPSRLAVVYHMDTVGRGALAAFFSLHRRLFMRGLLKAADRILVTSFDYLQHSAAAGFFRHDQGRFRELPPSVDPGRFAPGGKPPELLARYGLDAADRVALFVGGLDKAHYFKGIPVLLEAMATSGLGRSRAVIIGGGDLKEGYQRLAAELGLGQRVIFTGPVSEEELPSHYRLGDVFAFPSVDRSEAFGLAALEALATGLPVVAADLPGVRTIVRAGETGFRVPPGSVSALALRLSGILTDDSERQRLGSAARKMVMEEYADDARIRKLEHIVNELMK